MPLISTYTRKEYDSAYKIIICVDNIPICIAKDANDATSIVDYLNGCSDVMSDIELKCQLNRIKREFKNDK